MIATSTSAILRRGALLRRALLMLLRPLGLLAALLPTLLRLAGVEVPFGGPESVWRLLIVAILLRALLLIVRTVVVVVAAEIVGAVVVDVAIQRSIVVGW